MSDFKLLADTAVQTVIDDGASLADGARAAGDYNNGIALDIEAIAYLTVQYDSTAPSAGDSIAELYVLPGDGAGSEVFPEGGDAGLGSDDTPQAIYKVGVLESINPSTTVDEVLGTLPFVLYPNTNRFVILNTSGQTFDATWQLDIKPAKRQIV